MAEASAYKPEVKWDQTAYEALRATWSAERVAADEKRLKEMFNLAADSPLLAQELAWAEQHGIRLFVDHTVINLAGYYVPDMGVVAVAANGAHTQAKYVEALAHELRHAWQDYHGLLNRQSASFSAFFIKGALVEADAEAFGQRARDEYEAAQLKKQNKPVPEDLVESLENESYDLAGKFVSWFLTPFHLQYYGRQYSQGYAAVVPACKSDVAEGERQIKLPGNRELEAKRDGRGPGINIHNLQDVMQLGRRFSGVRNYLTQLGPDTLPKLVLSPALADSFYDSATAEQKKLTTRLRKADLRKRLSPKNKREYHPWP